MVGLGVSFAVWSCLDTQVGAGFSWLGPGSRQDKISTRVSAERRILTQRESQRGLKRLARAVKYDPHVIPTIFLVRCILKFSRVGVFCVRKVYFPEIV